MLSSFTDESCREADYWITRHDVCIIHLSCLLDTKAHKINFSISYIKLLELQ